MATPKNKIDLFRLQEGFYNAHNFVVLARSQEMFRDRNVRLMREELEEIIESLGYKIKEAD